MAASIPMEIYQKIVQDVEDLHFNNHRKKMAETFDQINFRIYGEQRHKQLLEEWNRSHHDSFYALLNQTDILEDPERFVYARGKFQGGCKCCKRHSKNRPIQLGQWLELPMRDSPDPVLDNSCECQCRHVLRFVCRVHGIIGVNPLD